MTIDEAQAEAERRWGPSAQVVESSHQRILHYTVGVRMPGESKFFPAIAGDGDSWEAAFAEADKRMHPLYITGAAAAAKASPLAPRDLLVHLRIWMEGHLSHLAARNYSGAFGSKGNSWSVCEVPDWDMRQRLAEIQAVLAQPTEASDGRN